jgi:hypothetical protein
MGDIRGDAEMALPEHAICCIRYLLQQKYGQTT